LWQNGWTDRDAAWTKNLEDRKFSLEISVPKVVLLCKFSLYRAVRAAVSARALRLQPAASWMIRPWLRTQGVPAPSMSGPAISAIDNFLP